MLGPLVRSAREWCGTLLIGTFFFRAYHAPNFPYDLDVDRSGRAAERWARKNGRSSTADREVRSRWGST